jgi:predicted 3-demethylubiquinone-9 3-methyltransferase (glyoxalase superfamily)
MMGSGIVPCLWFDGRALEATEFYISLFPDSHIDRILRSSIDTPGAEETPMKGGMPPRGTDPSAILAVPFSAR